MKTLEQVLAAQERTALVDMLVIGAGSFVAGVLAAVLLQAVFS